MNNEYIWMPHPAHFICARDCQFHLSTYVNGVIISTVGEYWPDFRVRQIIAQVQGIEIEGKGDTYDQNYMKKMGFEDIGCGYKYETMVFKAKKNSEPDQQCCPYVPIDYDSLDFECYNDSASAYEGHMKFCRKYGNEIEK